MKKRESLTLLGNICLVFVLVALLLLAANPSIAGEKEFLRVGISTPLTGPCAATGAHSKRGAMLAAEEINASGGILGKKIRLFFADDESNPAVGVAVAERLIAKDKVDVLAGTYNSSVCLAVMDVPAKYGVPYISGGATSDQIGIKRASNQEKYRAFYKVATPSYMYGKLWIWYWEYMLKEKFYQPKSKNIAVVNENSAWGNAITGAIEKYLKESNLYKEGYRIALSDQVPHGENDFLAEVTKIKAYEPGIVFGIFAAVPTNASFQKQFVSAGIRAPVCSVYAPNDPEFVKLTGSASNGLVWGSVMNLLPTNEGKHFTEGIRKKFNQDVEVVGSMVYDSIYMIKEAYERAGSLDREDFIKAMDKTRRKGAAGVYVFDPITHESIPGEEYIPSVVYQIQNEKSVPIWPPKHAEGSYEVPSWMK